MTTQNTLSRRKMMMASGAIVATGVAAGSSLANEQNSEIAQWESVIGQTFTIGRATSLRSVNRQNLTLVGVEVPSFDDPHRPAHFRNQFCLIFKPGRNTELQDGCHLVSNPEIGRKSIFLNEILDLDYSSQPVLQAVFS